MLKPIPKKIAERIKEIAKPHYGSWFKDNNAPYVIEGATLIAQDLLEIIEDLRGSLEDLTSFVHDYAIEAESVAAAMECEKARQALENLKDKLGEPQQEQEK